MTFLNSLKKWFYTNNSSAAGSAARIPLLDAAGNAVGSDTYNAIAQIVRQELATILSGADQGTSGTAFPSIASGVLGSMTAANLASVLGVASKNNQYVTHDPDTITTNGGGYIEIDEEKSPTGTYRGWYMLVKAYGINAFIEQYITPDNSANNSTIYWRRRFNNAWSGWQEISTDIPDFYKDYTTLASLSSALGGTFGQTGSITDFNLITVPGMYRNYDWSGFSNFPSGASGTGLLIVLEGVDSGWRVQVYIDMGGGMWLRHHNIIGIAGVWRRCDNV